MEAIYSSSNDLSILQTSLHRHIVPIAKFVGLNEPVDRLVGTVITQFLSDPSSDQNWQRMCYAIKDFMLNGEQGRVGELAGLRIMIILSDGTVAYDSSKDDSKNTFNNFKLGSINENHNSRVSVMSALLSKQGSGYEEKYSTTNKYKEAYHAVRVGSGPSSANGVIRISVKSV